MNAETKQCQNCRKSFIIEVQDFEFYEKMAVPPPTFCHYRRFQRRAAFRNERKLYRTKSAKSGQDILSLYPKESGTTVYAEKEWWSDDWDAMSYGQDYDFSKPFFSQFFELSKKVPRYNLDVLFMVNSDYSANANNLKNCYLLFNSNFSEDCAYGNAVDNCDRCFDNSHISKCERCYESFWLTSSHRTFFSSQCSNCLNVWFSKNCSNCTDCFGCVNLRFKQHCIFNEQYPKEEYEKKLQEMRIDTWDGLVSAQKLAHEFWLTFPNKYLQGIKNTEVSGEYVTNSKNVHYGYLVREGENLKYVQYLQVPHSKDCYDLTVWGQNNELAYENSVCGAGVYNVKFSLECWPEVRNIEYSMYCKSSEDLFGCFGLRKKKYCIFNKQYTKGEFDTLKAKIIQHMNDMPYTDKAGRVYTYGEFFPIELSPVPYNHSLAAEHFPLEEGAAQKEGWFWLNPDAQEYNITIEASSLPQTSKEANENILKEIIRCANCAKAYRIIAPELAFLQQESLPLPRLCVDCRHQRRILQRNKSVLYQRNCDCAGVATANQVYKNQAKHFHKDKHCPHKFETSYASERKEIIYCEPCYQAEIA